MRSHFQILLHLLMKLLIMNFVVPIMMLIIQRIIAMIYISLMVVMVTFISEIFQLVILIKLLGTNFHHTQKKLLKLANLLVFKRFLNFKEIYISLNYKKIA